MEKRLAKITRATSAKWTEEDRSKQYDEIMRFLSKTLADAKVQDVSQLVGKPVELTLEGGGFGTLKSWRILTEVL